MTNLSRRGFNGLAATAALTLCAPRLARADGKTVNIAIQYGFGYLPIMVASDLGLFGKHAVLKGEKDATFAITRLSGSPASIDALLGGRVDFCAPGLPAALILFDKTRASMKIKALTSITCTPYSLYTNNPAIKSLADFGPDDRIAVTAGNSPQAILLRIAAGKQLGNVDAFNTRMISLPHPDAVVALTAGKTIAGYFSTPPFSGFLAKDSQVHKILTSTDILGSSPTGAVLAAKGDFVAANPAIADAIVAALDEANAIIASDPRKAAEIYLKQESSKLTLDEVEALVRDPGMVFSVAPNAVMAYADFLYSQGDIKAPLAKWQDAFFPNIDGRKGS